MFSKTTIALAMALVVGLTSAAAAQETKVGVDIGPSASAGVYVGPTQGYGPAGSSYYSPDLRGEIVPGSQFGYVAQEADYNTGFHRRAVRADEQEPSINN